MAYAEITFNERNPIKRWLQKQRLISAINLYRLAVNGSPEAICDFGAGNGELCKLLTKYYKNAGLTCYEPTPYMMAEARRNLTGLASVDFCRDIQAVPNETFDGIFCLELFEHLPGNETKEALERISKLLKPDGIVVIGVPVETGIPALYKGLFRMSRRFGTFDANLKNVTMSIFGFPPKDRPVSEITPGYRYHFYHVGFDFHELKKILSRNFRIRNVSTSPFKLGGSWLMPEIYFIAEKLKKN